MAPESRSFEERQKLVNLEVDKKLAQLEDSMRRLSPVSDLETLKKRMENLESAVGKGAVMRDELKRLEDKQKYALLEVEKRLVEVESVASQVSKKAPERGDIFKRMDELRKSTDADMAGFKKELEGLRLDLSKSIVQAKTKISERLGEDEKGFAERMTEVEKLVTKRLAQVDSDTKKMISDAEAKLKEDFGALEKKAEGMLNETESRFSKKIAEIDKKDITALGEDVRKVWEALEQLKGEVSGLKSRTEAIRIPDIGGLQNRMTDMEEKLKHALEVHATTKAWTERAIADVRKETALPSDLVRASEIEPLDKTVKEMKISVVNMNRSMQAVREELTKAASTIEELKKAVVLPADVIRRSDLEPEAKRLRNEIYKLEARMASLEQWFVSQRVEAPIIME